MLLKKSILAAIMLLSCIPTHAETRTFDINNIHSIEIGTGVSLSFTQGPLKKMEINANNEDFKFLNLHDNKGKLTIQFVPSHSVSNPNISIYIQAPNVSYFRASIGSRITFQNNLKCNDKLTLIATVGSSITAGNIRAKSIEAYVTTGSELKVSDFDSGNLNIKMSAGDNVNIDNVTATEFSIDIGTGGSATIENFNGSILHATSGTGSTSTFKNVTATNANLQLNTSSSMYIHKIDVYDIKANLNIATTLDIAGKCTTADMSLYDKRTINLNTNKLYGSININYDLNQDSRRYNYNYRDSQAGKIIINDKEHRSRYNSSENSRSQKRNHGKIVINGKEYQGMYNSHVNSQHNYKTQSDTRNKKKTRKDYRLEDLNP